MLTVWVNNKDKNVWTSMPSLQLFGIVKSQRNAKMWADIWLLHLNLTTCEGDICISKANKKCKFHNTSAPPTILQIFFYIARKRCYHLYRLTDARVKKAQRRGIPRWHPCVWHHRRATVALRLLKTQPLHLLAHGVFLAFCRFEDAGLSGFSTLWSDWR